MISLLQYMKETSLDNPEVTVKDKRIVKLDEIVTEVKQSEEWEDVKMNLLEYGLERGMERGIELGKEHSRIEMICRKLRKGRSAAMIAEDLDEDYETVKVICEIAGEFAPLYDSDQVCEEYLKNYK